MTYAMQSAYQSMIIAQQNDAQFRSMMAAQRLQDLTANTSHENAARLKAQETAILIAKQQADLDAAIAARRRQRKLNYAA